MIIDDIQREKEIAKCKAQLIKELKAAYAKQQKDGDWVSFGERIKGIYISYSTCDNEIYHLAMRDVLAGAVKNGLDPEIISGNYGLKVQVYDTISKDLKIAEDMCERYGEQVMRRYLESFNACQTYAMCVAMEDKKSIAKQFDMLKQFFDKAVLHW